LIATGARAGRYSRIILPLRRQFEGSVVRSLRDADHAGCTFPVLENRISLSWPGAQLALFRSPPDGKRLGQVPAPELGAAWRLHHGTQALCTRNIKFFKFSLSP